VNEPSALAVIVWFFALPSVAAAREIDGRKVERQTEQVIAQRAGHELVDFIADLNRGATHDFTRGIGAARQEGERIEEGVDQAQLLIARRGRIRVHHVTIGVDAVDGLPQQRMAESVDGMCELGHDGRIDSDVGGFEFVNVRLNAACKLFKHEVLILHLGSEPGRLEQSLTVPFGVLNAIG
jgi:hypothetical protein